MEGRRPSELEFNKENDIMGVIRPGGFELTKEAIEKAGIKKGSKILDIGCGEGDTADFLTREMGMDVTGIDKSKDMIEKANAKYPDLKLQFGEADFLEFSSFEFDAVLMECVFSVAYLKTEVLHEIYCVLKKGGKLIITDLYNKNPDPEAVKKAVDEWETALSTPKVEGECGDKKIPPEFMLNGAFIKDELVKGAKETELELELWEDKSDALATFVAEKIMDYGSMDKYFEEVVPPEETKDCFCRASDNNKDLGYFLLVLKKPE